MKYQLNAKGIEGNKNPLDLTETFRLRSYGQLLSFILEKNNIKKEKCIKNLL